MEEPTARVEHSLADAGSIQKPKPLIGSPLHPWTPVCTGGAEKAPGANMEMIIRKQALGRNSPGKRAREKAAHVREVLEDVPVGVNDFYVQCLPPSVHSRSVECPFFSVPVQTWTSHS
jgi:hypothetical protein